MRPDYTRKQILSDVLVVLFFIGVAFGLAAVEAALADKARDLRDNGALVNVQVTRVERASNPYVHFRYQLDGREYTSSARGTKPAPSVGTQIIGRYQPDDPTSVRIRPVDEATIEEDGEPFRGLRYLLLFPLAILIAARAALVTKRHPLDLVGPTMGIGLLVVVVAVNFSDDVGKVLVDRLGERVLGLQAPVAVSLAEVVILGPLLLMWSRAALELTQVAALRGVRPGGLRFLLWVASGRDAAIPSAHRQRFLAAGGLLLLLLFGLALALSLTE